MAQSMWCSEVRSAVCFFFFFAVKRNVDCLACNSKCLDVTGGPLDPYVAVTVASC